MSEDIHFYEPLHGHGLPHDPIKAIVAPRPIGWISTLSREGVANLAPYSFFNALCTNPPILAFANEKASDSLRNARETGEFVYNLATAALATQMSASSEGVPPDVDEFTLAGVERASCRIVAAPRVAASPASLECRVLQILHLQDLDGNATGVEVVFGQVVGVHIDRAFLKDGKFDTAAARPLARCGNWSDYAVVDQMFNMRRPPQLSPQAPTRTGGL